MSQMFPSCEANSGTIQRKRSEDLTKSSVSAVDSSNLGEVPRVKDRKISPLPFSKGGGTRSEVGSFWDLLPTGFFRQTIYLRSQGPESGHPMKGNLPLKPHLRPTLIMAGPLAINPFQSLSIFCYCSLCSQQRTPLFNSANPLQRTIELAH